MSDLDNFLPDDLKGVVAFKTKASDNAESGSASKEEPSLVAMAGSDTEEDNLSPEQVNKNKGVQAMPEQATAKAEIKEQVEALLAEKDAQQKVEARIAGLEDEKNDLNEKLTDVESVKATLSEELEQVKANLQAKTDEVSSLAKEKESLEQTVSQLQSELTGMKEEKALASRQAVLEEAGILFAEGEKRDTQLNKVKAMKDEEFDSYKEELVEVFSLGKSTSAKTEEKNEEPKTTKKANASEQESSEEEVDSADIELGRVYQQAVAAINSDISLDEDAIEEYSNM